MIVEHDSIITQTISRIFTPFIQLFGLYVIMHGHSSPGGGFQGGVILGASFILLGISFGIEKVENILTKRIITIFTSLGVLIYAGVGVTCMVLGANFLDYSALPVIEPRAMGMLIIEIGVGITVMAVIVLIFHALITFE